jgi:ureidoacrylate peracid hydrolase
MLPSLSDLVTPSKTAVLVVDVQNDFCEPAGAAGKSGKDISAAMTMIPTLQRFLVAAREHGTNVIFVQTIHEPSTDSEAWIGRRSNPDAKNCLKGTWGADFTGVAPLSTEPVVIKHRYSAFINTRLDSVLRTLKVENIIVLGVATNVCVESTSRHGYMLDYHTVFISDCSAAYNQAAHDMTLKVHAKHFGTVATSQDIIDCWSRTHAVAASA